MTTIQTSNDEPSTIVIETAATGVAGQRRILFLDVLRGTAVLGILLMNIQSFSMPGSAYVNPVSYGDLHGINLAVWFASHLLADQKFLNLFCLLFGAGIYLMTSRADAAGRDPALLHYRRMAWLGLFGLLHAHLLWSGDILFDYALCGMLVYPLRRLSPKVLMVLGLAGVLISSGIMFGYGRHLSQLPPDTIHAVEQELWHPTAEMQENELRAYRGGWIAQMQQRQPDAMFAETILFAYWAVWRESGLMLIGIALFKLGVLTLQKPAFLYGCFVAVALSAGMPLIVYGTWRDFHQGWAFPYSFFYGMQFNQWGSLAVTLGWIGVIAMILRAAAPGSVAKRLASAGRMAFTNYVLQTLICTMIFFGSGLGLFGRVDRLGQLAITVVIWAVLLVVTPLWLKHFYYGPLEWLWRSLTYWKLEPFRR